MPSESTLSLEQKKKNLRIIIDKAIHLLIKPKCSLRRIDGRNIKKIVDEMTALENKVKDIETDK